MTKKDKEAQLKAKLLKMKLAIVKSPDKYKVPREMKHTRADSDGPLVNKVPFGEEDRETKQQGMDRIMRDSSYDVKNKKVRPAKPTQADRKRIITAKDHHHKISFRGHKIGGFKGASLSGQSGKYAKYWLLNAKETNGNGWGIAAHTAKENMKKFIGRPLVVTAQSWHGASEYGDEYEHPYLPTNDINAILNHQEKFRVGSIVDVFEDSHGDWFASIEMLPKFASSRLPPFCSPAIYQLDASEAEGQISKWEALHLAALTENPAYGARIALLKGTCVGTNNECKVQFKSAKQESGIECPVKEKQKKVKSKLSKLKKKQKISRLKQRLAYEGGSNYDRQITDLSKNFEGQRDEITKRRPDSSVGKQPKNEFGHTCTNEATCGATSGFLRNKLILDHGLNYKQVKVEGGMYTGPGGEFSSAGVNINGTPEVEHEWVRLDDDTIIDGSAGQFMDQKNKINQKQRFRVIPPNAPLQKYYKGHYEHSPTGSKKWYNKNDPLKKSVDKYERKMKKGKLKAKLARDDIEKAFDNYEPHKDDIARGKRIDKIFEYTDAREKSFDGEGEQLADYINKGKKIRPTGHNAEFPSTLKKKFAKLKLKLANLGEQNMTYQESKKVKIHKKKHPEVRKASLASEFAHDDIEGILRGIHSSPLPPNKREHQSSFLSSTGDYIGGGEDHTETIKSIFKDKEFTPEDKGNDGPVTRFSIEHKLPRVQRRMTRRGGRVSFGIHSPINKTQLRSMQDVEKAGEELAFVVGPDVNGTVGEGYRDLTKALRENKYLG